MKKPKSNIARNAVELAEILNLPPSFALEMEVRHSLNKKIIEVIKKKGLTHAQVAKLAGTSRTRITALMNYNCDDISIELMLRVLYSLGLQAKLKFTNKAA